MSLRGEKGTAAGTGSGTARPEAEASTERPLPHVAGPSARRLSGTRSPCHDHQMALSLILCFLSLDCGSYEGGSLGSYQSLGNGTGREEQSGRVEEWGGDSDLLTEGTATPIPRKTDRKWRLQLKLPHLNGRSAPSRPGLSGALWDRPIAPHPQAPAPNTLALPSARQGTRLFLASGPLHMRCPLPGLFFANCLRDTKFSEAFLGVSIPPSKSGPTVLPLSQTFSAFTVVCACVSAALTVSSMKAGINQSACSP